MRKSDEKTRRSKADRENKPDTLMAPEGLFPPTCIRIKTPPCAVTLIYETTRAGHGRPGGGGDPCWIQQGGPIEPYSQTPEVGVRRGVGRLGRCGRSCGGARLVTAGQSLGRIKGMVTNGGWTGRTCILMCPDARGRTGRAIPRGEGVPLYTAGQPTAKLGVRGGCRKTQTYVGLRPGPIPCEGKVPGAAVKSLTG